jgi:hypothetical protein
MDKRKNENKKAAKKRGMIKQSEKKGNAEKEITNGKE